MSCAANRFRVREAEHVLTVVVCSWTNDVWTDEDWLWVTLQMKWGSREIRWDVSLSEAVPGCLPWIPT